MIEYQHTIKEPITLKGTGLHTGKKVTLTFQPAEPNHGIKFQRIDLEDKPIIKADADLVTTVERGTTIESGPVKVSTIEHCLAALVGMEVDNILIQLDQAELPILDGSSVEFCEALVKAGIEKQDAEKEYFDLRQNISYHDEDKEVKILAIPAENYQLTVMIDYNSPVLGSQHASIEHVSEFHEHVSKARTFCFLHELEYLYENGLIKGGDLNNAIVVVDRKVEAEEMTRLAKMFNKPNIEVKKEGILNNIELRHRNEPARHKLLDVIGDLALVGTPIKGKIIATRPGHKSNVEFAKKLKQHIREQKKKNIAPSYDVNAKPVADVLEIMSFLPHRYPMLLVDKIVELTEKKVVAVKNVTMNESFFQGHFPDSPIMPGVLIIESMAQAGGIMLMKTQPDPENYLTYFLRIEKARFKNPVVPGDTLIFELELLSPIRRGICEMKGTAWVGDKIATEAILVAQMVKKPEAK